MVHIIAAITKANAMIATWHASLVGAILAAGEPAEGAVVTIVVAVIAASMPGIVAAFLAWLKARKALQMGTRNRRTMSRLVQIARENRHTLKRMEPTWKRLHDWLDACDEAARVKKT